MPGVDTSINSAPSDHEPAKAVSFLGALKVPVCITISRFQKYLFASMNKRTVLQSGALPLGYILIDNKLS